MHTDNLVWWIGAIHLGIYGVIEWSFLITWAVRKPHSMARLVGRIMHWHHARLRWTHRAKNGLTDAEWTRGEPRP